MTWEAVWLSEEGMALGTERSGFALGPPCVTYMTLGCFLSHPEPLASPRTGLRAPVSQFCQVSAPKALNFRFGTEKVLSFSSCLFVTEDTF